MSDRLKRLVEEQNTVWKRMQDIRGLAETENRDWTAEERTNWDEAEARLTVVSGDIERLERDAKRQQVDRSQHVATVESGDEQKVTTVNAEERYGEVFTNFLRRGIGSLTFEDRNLLEQGFERVERAQAAGTDAAGGYLVPEGFRNVLTESMLSFGGLLSIVNNITTATGNRLPWPTNNDTGNIGAILGENTQIAEQDLTLGENDLGAFTYTSKLVRVSLQLLQDEAFDLETWLPRKLGERIGRAIAAHVAVGAGTTQPLGVVPGGTVGVTGAVAATAAITYDNLIDLEHSVNSAYRGRAVYAFADTTLALLRKLKDADGRPIWQPVPVAGQPATINGVRYVIDDAIAAPAVAAKSIVYGDLQAGYVARSVLGVQMMQLRERYADYLQVGFLAFHRFDSTPDDTAAYRVFQHGAAS